jgi:hypothetical protein
MDEFHRDCLLLVGRIIDRLERARQFALSFGESRAAMLDAPLNLNSHTDGTPR